VLWGCYHGALLVLHRQVQSLQRKFDWNPARRPGEPLSWLATVALVNLGWIFFRTNSIPERRPMLSAVLSPASYSARFLSGSLYALGLRTRRTTCDCAAGD
jgi:D-alanyl-lipoteichoic acid acyltransferase DltB (MBOAT superfamily)